MFVPRLQQKNVERLLFPGKVLVLHGARRVGKTTLVQHFLRSVEEPCLSVTGEDAVVQDYLSSDSLERLKAFVGHRRLLVVDEAQHVAGIGRNLKLLVDHVPDLKILATGSSSLALSDATGEPLTGRQFRLQLHPLSQAELALTEAPHETRARLERRLVYGCYPEVATISDNGLRTRLLVELVNSYLLRDVLSMEGVRKSHLFQQLLRLLALQIGAEVSTNELGRQLGVSKNTVERYLQLLVDSFVLFRLGGFSRNLRKEVVRSSRYFFVDNGIRNALLNNFSPLNLRADVGGLWENFVVMERLKRNELLDLKPNLYFWRTYDQQEVGLVEERHGQIAAFEIKWNPAKGRRPKGWARAYPDAEFNVVHPDNYLEFV